MRLQLQKYENYLNSKNEFKELLGPFNKELYKLFIFFETLSNFQSLPTDSRCAPALFFPHGVQQKPYTAERWKMVKRCKNWTGSPQKSYPKVEFIGSCSRGVLVV